MKKLIFAMAVAAAGAAAAGVSFSYQGALKNADGTSIPVSESNKTIEFRLYEGPTDSNALWGLQTIVHLDENGLFNVELSDTLGTPLTNVKTNNLDWVLASYLGNSKTLYIGLNVVGSTGEIRPRQKLLNVPAAAFAADVAHAKNNFEVDGIATFYSTVNAETNMTVKGSLTVSKGLTAAGGLTVSAGTLSVPGGGIVPKGGIIMWSGEASTIPDGWALCDGSNDTPDLRGRFIVGASANKDEKGAGVDISYLYADKGGASSVRLSVEAMPNHSHTLYWMKTYYEIDHPHIWSDEGPFFLDELSGKEFGAKVSGAVNVKSEGGNAPHENRPPYYALCFIIKK